MCVFYMKKSTVEKKETKSNGVYSVNKTCPAHITVFVQNKNTKNKTERAHHMVIILRAFSNSCYPIILWLSSDIIATPWI